MTLSPSMLLWDEYRLRRKWLLTIWLTYLPGVAIIGIPLSALLDSDFVFSIVAGIWMVAFVVAVVRLASFPCPRGHRPFFGRGDLAGKMRTLKG